MTNAISPLVDLSQPTRIHVVGVGGAGMSAIAAVLAAMGHVVTGQRHQALPLARAPARPRRRDRPLATGPRTSPEPRS